MLMLPWFVELIDGLLNEMYGVLCWIFVSGICGLLPSAVVRVDAWESNGSSE